MVDLFRQFFRKKSYPLNKILISKDALLNNYQYLASINPQIKIAPVLKSNAYGHGITLVGKIMDSLNPPFLCVDSLYEANLLKDAGVKTTILIMGYIDPLNLKRKKLPYSYSVWDIEQAKVINEYQKGASVHIFVDTGMGREGVRVRCQRSDIRCQNPQDCLLHFIESLKKLKNINIVGLMTHLAISEDGKNPLTQKQILNFKISQEIASSANLKLKWIHVGGGMAALSLKNPPCNLIRAGKILYGVIPSEINSNLKPALKFISKIVQIKKIKKGDRVGYDGTFIADKEMTMAVLPIGYNDGLDRRFSSDLCNGKCGVLVEKTWCSILGRVSMNITTIDISNVKNPFVGQEVVVYSNDNQDPNSLENTSKTIEKIPYDLMVHLDASIKRIVWEIRI